MRYHGAVLDHGKPFATIEAGEPFPPLVTMKFTFSGDDEAEIEINMDVRQATEIARHLTAAANIIVGLSR